MWFNRTLLTLCCFPLALFANSSATPGNFNLTRNGLVFSADNGNYQGNFGGRLSYEANAFQNNQHSLNNGADLQEIYSALSATFFQTWQFFTDQSWMRVNKLENLNLSYIGSSWFGITFGQLTPSYGFSNDAATPYTTMVTLALPAYAFSPAYNVGSQIELNSDHFAFYASLTGPQIAENVPGHWPWAWTSRFFYSPVHTDTSVFHIGTSIWQQFPSSPDNFSISTVPQVIALQPVSLISTPTISNTQSNITPDLELAWIHHGLDIQAEYFLSRTIRTGNQPDLTFRGYYIEGGYFLTGESFHYTYPGGYVDGVTKPHHSYGALQLTAEWSYLNLNDADITGGEQRGPFAGVSWYLNQNVILKFNAGRIIARLPDTNQRYYNNVYALKLILLF